MNIRYRTAQAPHLMTIPLREWSPISGGHVAGTNLAWDTTQADTDDMIQGLVDLFLPFWPNTTTFNSYTINTYLSQTSPARPQITKTMTGKVGTGGATIPAAQATFNFKTSNFFPFKIVMLDARVSSTFQPLETLATPADDDEIALRNYVLDDQWSFSGRDNYQPTSLERITYTLNEKLRHSYHLD